MTIELKIYGEDDEGDFEETVEFPSKWVVCGDCRGEGKYPNRAISPTGDGSWTQSEMAEAEYEDPDFREDYFSGRYDVACRTCDGRTTVKIVDDAFLTNEQREKYEQYLEHERDMADFRAEQAAERRNGA